MAVPTIYMWNDVGAPARTEPATNDGYHAYMHKVLKACLVDGYGSKAGLGWTLIGQINTANARAIAFSNGAGTGCVRLHCTSNQPGYIGIRAFTSMTDVDTGTNGQGSTTYGSINVQPLLEWCVIGDSRTFYLIFKAHSNYSSIMTLNNNIPPVGFLSAGEYDHFAPSVMAQGQVGNFVLWPWDGANYMFHGAWNQVVLMPNLSTGAPNGGGVRANVLQPGGHGDWGKTLLTKALVGSVTAPPNPSPFVTAGQLRFFGAMRGAYQSLANDHSAWRAAIDAGTLTVGTVMNINGKNFIPALSCGDTSTYISLAAEDWS